MSYWILVFNQQRVSDIDPDRLFNALARSNFNTLCKQYELDMGLIDLAREHLAISSAPGSTALCLLLRYLPEGQPLVGVYRWQTGSDTGRKILSRAVKNAFSEEIRGKLQTAIQIFGIELSPTQVRDMGLLLGYELARWLADQGQGIIQGVDGLWYRLNRYLAFLPVEE